jgi:hypothetical protein
MGNSCAVQYLYMEGSIIHIMVAIFGSILVVLLHIFQWRFAFGVAGILFVGHIIGYCECSNSVKMVLSQKVWTPSFGSKKTGGWRKRMTILPPLLPLLQMTRLLFGMR